MRLVRCSFLLAALALPSAASAQTPVATLVPAPLVELPGQVDSNSPAVWDLRRGQPVLTVITSVAGTPSVATGADLARLRTPRRVRISAPPGDGVWMEAVLVDEAGTWYGYYHNEVPATACGRPTLMTPRIGAARSRDRGRTWENLGIVLEAPADGTQCRTGNKYFVGGVGDPAVVLNEAKTDVYLYFSQYSRQPSAQGVAVARIPWAERDAPAGRAEVWVNGIWAQPRVVESEAGERQIEYPAGTPLVRPVRPWHDGDARNDAFWGAAIHWNTYLQQYVMLLNRTSDEAFTQEGIYVSFAPRLDDPRAWSVPRRILAGGAWYPQVIGLEPGRGTDKEAGQHARFFMSGESRHIIDFTAR